MGPVLWHRNWRARDLACQISVRLKSVQGKAGEFKRRLEKLVLRREKNGEHISVCQHHEKLTVLFLCKNTVIVFTHLLSLPGLKGCKCFPRAWCEVTAGTGIAQPECNPCVPVSMWSRWTCARQVCGCVLTEFLSYLVSVQCSVSFKFTCGDLLPHQPSLSNTPVFKFHNL